MIDLTDAPDQYTVTTVPDEGWVKQRIYLNGRCVHTTNLTWKVALHKGQSLIDQACVALRQAEQTPGKMKKAPG